MKKKIERLLFWNWFDLLRINFYVFIIFISESELISKEKKKERKNRKKRMKERKEERKKESLKFSSYMMFWQHQCRMLHVSNGCLHHSHVS